MSESVLKALELTARMWRSIRKQIQIHTDLLALVAQVLLSYSQVSYSLQWSRLHLYRLMHTDCANLKNSIDWRLIQKILTSMSREPYCVGSARYQSQLLDLTSMWLNKRLFSWNNWARSPTTPVQQNSWSFGCKSLWKASSPWHVAEQTQGNCQRQFHSCLPLLVEKHERCEEGLQNSLLIWLFDTYSPYQIWSHSWASEYARTP